MNEKIKQAFEEACADWDFNFTPVENGNGYLDYHTGIMFGMFLKGWEAHEHYNIAESKRTSANTNPV
jgi:hypothetical protein